MTISTTTIKNSYNGNNSTSAFNYTFKISAESEMQVIIRSSTGSETVKSLSTHYTISNVGNAGGGAVTFTSGNIPASGETVILRRVTAQTQAMDLIDNDPMSADTIETAHDKAIAITQELQEQIDRSLKLSRTNTMTSTEFTIDATNRAGKVLGFDTTGELSVTSEIGTNRGNWSASISYAIRDIVKDTSTNNIFMANTVHTSSGSQPLTTNTDSAKWDLLVDAASATTASTSATNSANAASASASTASGHASTATTKASEASASAATASTKASEATTAKNAAVTAQAAAEAALDTFDDRFLGAKSSDPSVDNDGASLVDGAIYFDTTNDIMKVYDLTNTQWRQLTLTSTNQAHVNVVSGIQAAVTGVNNISAAVSSVNSNATNINTLAGTSGLPQLAAAHAAVTNVNNNLTSVNNFAEVYRISANAPSSSLNNGDLWYDSTANKLKIYDGSSFALAGSSVNGTTARFKFTATANQTTFSGSDANSNTLAYDVAGGVLFADIYLNGIKLVAGTDVTATNGTSVVLATGASVNDILEIVTFGTFSLSNIAANDLTDVSTGGVSDGQVLVYNSGNSRFQPGSASSAEVYGFNKTYTVQTLVKTVTVAGGKFVIDGVSQDTLELNEGDTIKFDQSDNTNSGHPFVFSTNVNNSPSASYTTGVTTSGTPGNAGAFTQIVVATGAPTLYYYCSNHSNMGGTANTPTPALNNLQVTTTNKGADNITSSTYANFDDVLFSASGFTFSISNGNLISTI
ncbi:hypothetical protein N9O39_00665 [Candidatus Pelagibacter sp.]|nr:hypothetical protein [Candidatus Pelagibacter sp.]